MTILLAAFLAAHALPPAPTPEEALFARIKSLAGEWREKSTKGWTGSDKIAVIARGSAVLFESSFDTDKESGMATLFYMDKGRVLLTHYCEARNQPTLAATSISPDGSSATFTFVSGTGMKSRDDGHMDEVAIHFIGPNSYTEQWSWYANGQSKLFETIEYRRADAAKH